MEPELTPIDPPPAAHASTVDVPIDLARYLLDPPPTAEQLARRARTRTAVRWGSIAACVLVAVFLLLPTGGAGSTGGSSVGGEGTGDDGTGVVADPVPAPGADPAAAVDALPKRVDVAPAAPRARRRRTAATGRARTTAPARATRPRAASIGATSPTTPRSTPRTTSVPHASAAPHRAATAPRVAATAAPQVATSDPVAPSSAVAPSDAHALDQSAQFDG